MLSVILPSYNEEENILNTASVLEELFCEHGIAYELLFVDDGSRDGTWQKICEANEKDGNVRGLRFSRNFGKESAIFAGLEASKGDACVVMDCDLQHPPKTIIEMYKLWQGGKQVIEGKKSSRGKENALYGGLSKLFYKLIKKASGIDMLDASDFKLLDRKAVDALLAMPERVTFFRAMSSWVGFESANVYYDVDERAYGSRKWSTKGLIKYAISNLSSYTDLPLLIPAFIGTAVCFISAVLIVLNVCGVPLGSFSLSANVLLFVGGMILVSVGVLGYYLWRIFDETRNRPRYIIAKTVGGKQ